MQYAVGMQYAAGVSAKRSTHTVDLANICGVDRYLYSKQVKPMQGCMYKARHAHKCLYTVLPKYSKIQVLPGITSCRLVKDNKQAIELNSLLINNMPEGGYG